MKTIHMLKSQDVLTKLSSHESGMPKDSPRGKNRSGEDTGKALRYMAPFFSAPLLLLFAITVCAAFLAEEATIGYASLVAFGLFLYVWYTFYRHAIENIEKNEALCGAYLRVIREGEELLVPSEDLVCGDILLMAQGDRLFADCRILDTHGLTVREWQGGKALDVDKHALSCEGHVYDAANMLWTGSVILTGSCRAAVVAVGDQRRVTDQGIRQASNALFAGKFAAWLKKLSLIASAALLGTVFLAAIFGLTPLSSGGLWRDWLFAVSFAATSAVELLTLILTISLGKAISLHKTVLSKSAKALEAFASVDHAILPARALWDELSYEANALLLPDPKGSVIETPSATLSEAGDRILKNAYLTVAACECFGILSPVWQKTLAEPILTLCEAYKLGYTEATEALGVTVLENAALCRIFKRGKERFVSLCGDCRYLLSLSGFWYRGKTIAPLRESDGMRFLKAGAIGVAIGALSADTELSEKSLIDALSGKLVFEGAILTVPDTSALTSWYNAFSGAGISLTVACDGAFEYSFLKRLIAKMPITLLDASDPSALAEHIAAKKRAGKTVLFEMRETSDCDAAEFSDLSLFHTELVKREAQKREDCRELWANGAVRSRWRADLLYSASSTALAEKKRALSDAYDRVTKATSYLFCTLALKFFPTVFAIILGKDLVSALFFVLMGFGFDTLAVFSILYRPNKSVYRAFSPKRLIESVIASLASGLLTSVGVLAFALVSSTYFSLSAEVFSTVTLLAVSLVSFWLRYFQPRLSISPTASLGTGLTVGGCILLFVLLLARGSFGKVGLLFLLFSVLILLLSEGAAWLVLKKLCQNTSKKVKNRAKKVKKRLDKSKKV